ncbi:hypothetical protein CMI37_19470 [Candidatus Pacearchaeota archaeon]|nr:hypothetical protein [Candidatus Pacearchaeota archaeon]|tara:strand:- start:147 stop:1463 length:1317 start_codon:yes stop_codon:yes gene_type:complete
MPISNETKYALRHRVSRAFRDLIAVNGSLVGPTTSRFHSPNLIFERDTDVKGGEVSFWQGGGLSLAGEPLGAPRVITSATPGAAGSQGQINTHVLWGAAPSTNSGWEIHKLFERAQYDDAINGAIRRGGRRQLSPGEEYFIGNSYLRNSAFDIIPKGEALAANLTTQPAGWTKDANSTTQIRSAFPFQGRHYLQLITDGNNLGRFHQTMFDWAKIAGETVTLNAMVWANTADRVSIELNSTESSKHPATSGNDGEGLWRELSVEVTLANNVNDVNVSLEVTAGSTVIASIGKIWLSGGPIQYEYPIENRWAFIQDVYVEDNLHQWTPLPKEWWYINKDRTPRELGFVRDFYSPEAGRAYKITGQTYPTPNPAESDNIEIDPEYAFARTFHNLYMQLPRGNQQSVAFRELAFQAEREAADWERRSQVKPMQGSKPVEDL